nr:MAG TPA: hypothetical protein [Caudoviricetes sp.]
MGEQITIEKLNTGRKVLIFAQHGVPIGEYSELEDISELSVRQVTTEQKNELQTDIRS